MTTLTLNIDDKVAARMRQASKGMDIERYIEYFLVKQFAAPKRSAVLDETKKYNHEALCGIFTNDFDLDKCREEYLSEKYGL